MEVVGGYISPVTDAYNKKGLAKAVDRVAMAKLAVSSRFFFFFFDTLTFFFLEQIFHFLFSPFWFLKY